MKKPKIIVLDFDGPLLDGMNRHYQCYQDILIGRGYRPLSIKHYWEQKRNRVDRRQLLMQSDASDFYQDFLADWLERIEEQRYLSLDTLQPRVVEVLERWSASGIRLTLVTMRRDAAGVHWQLDRFGISQFLDDVLVTGTVDGAMGKARSIEALHGATSEADMLWIGDTEVDSVAAREVGASLCLLSCGLRGSGYLASLRPDFLHEDLATFSDFMYKDCIDYGA